MLQISVNKQNTQLMAVGNFTTVDGQSPVQIAKFDIGNAPTSRRPDRAPDAFTLVDHAVHLCVLAEVRDQP